MPAHIEPSVTFDSIRFSSAVAPTATVIAASPCQPSRIAPQSIEIRSPAFSTLSPGMPCTTSSFTEAQITPGNHRPPWSARKLEVAPCLAMTWSAMSFSSPVVTPGATASRHAFRASATTSPAARILAICSGVLISTIWSTPSTF